MPSNPHGLQQKQQNHVGMYLVYKLKRIAQQRPSFMHIHDSFTTPTFYDMIYNFTNQYPIP